MHVVQIGCGTIGLAYASALANKGVQVTILEKSHAVVERYMDTCDIFHVEDEGVELLRDVAAVFLAVPTPLQDERLDFSCLAATLLTVQTIVSANPQAVVVLRSTLMPGVTRWYSEKLTHLCGHNVTTAHQPEFLRAAKALSDARQPSCIVIGLENMLPSTNELPGELLPLYHLAKLFVPESKICFTTFEEAELGKMIHNAFNAAKISFFNQAWRLASAVSAASRTPVSMDVIQQFLPSSCEGLWNPKYGTVSGAPYGGHCLPKDSQAMAFLESALLTDIADRQKSCPQLFKAVVEVNEAMGRSADGHTTTKALVAPAFPAHVDTSKYDMMPSKGLSTDHNLLEICAGLHLL